jgi:thiosulfate/3-mercaptopyruvate sulfurtransferase
MLRWLGHEAVQVLDGGWKAWLAAGGEAVAGDTPPGAPPPAPGTWQAAPQAGWLRLVDEVQADVQGPRTLCLVDARAPDRFRGENETLDPVGGHIPGARNHFFQLNLQPDGRFKAPETLREAFTALLKSQPLDTVVHQCGSGVTACHNLLAMVVAGLPPTALYAGSWSEWCSDPARPVARD